MINEQAITAANNLVGDVDIDQPNPELSYEPVGLKEGLKYTLDSHPLSVTSRSLASRAWQTLRSVPEDIRQSDHKVRTIGALALGLATQVLDRSRLGMTYLVAHPAIDEFKDSHSITKTGLVAAAGFMVWNTVVGESLNVGFSEYDQTKKVGTKNFPLVVKVLEEVLPGVDTQDQPTKEPESIVNKTPVIKRIRNIPSSVWLNFRRMGVGLGTGSTPFVGLTRAQEHSYLEGTKQNLKVGASTSVAVGAIGLGVAQYITEIEDEDPQQVQDILNAIEDPKVWLAIGVAFMGLQYYLNKRKKAEILKRDSEATPNQPIETRQ